MNKFILPLLASLLFVYTSQVFSQDLNAFDPSSFKSNIKSPLKLRDILNNLPKTESSSTKNNVEIQKVISVDKKIVEIEITGNNLVPSSTILNEIFLKIGDELSPYKINRVRKNIYSLGIFKNVRTLVETIPNKGKKIIFVIEERSPIIDIIINGNKTISSSLILNALSSQKGEIENQNLIRKDITAIKNLYTNLGYSHAKVISVQIAGEDKNKLEINLSEGIIERFEVTGNTKTNDYVILRELSMKSGDAFQIEKFNTEMRKIFNLNYFTGLNYDIKPGSTPDQIVIVIEVVEKESSGQLTFGGGFSAQLGFSLFSDFFMDNLMGTGQTIMLKGQFYLGGTDSAGQNSTYQFKYTNPWMFGKRRSFTFKTWFTKGLQASMDFLSSQQEFVNATKKGMEVTFGAPFSYQLKTFHSFKDETVELPDEFIKYKVDSYKFLVSNDSRDVWFNPKNGAHDTFSIEKSFMIYDDSLDFTKYDVSLTRFHEVLANQVFALRYELGLIESPEILEQDKFKSEYYVVGGGSTVRGYDERGYSFGNKKSLLSMEYRLLFNETFQGVLFVDTGLATMGSLADLSNYKIGKGVGMRMNIPGMGPLRLDFGFGETGTMRTHFSMGHSF
ncbi:BamA/TamA family outer membrane protein [bacterium]|nr:BamA/TamA family outer membrane protein [bacterium]